MCEKYSIVLTYRHFDTKPTDRPTDRPCHNGQTDAQWEKSTINAQIYDESHIISKMKKKKRKKNCCPNISAPHFYNCYRHICCLPLLLLLFLFLLVLLFLTLSFSNLHTYIFFVVRSTWQMQILLIVFLGLVFQWEWHRKIYISGLSL